MQSFDLHNGMWYHGLRLMLGFSKESVMVVYKISESREEWSEFPQVHHDTFKLLLFYQIKTPKDIQCTIIYDKEEIKIKSANAWSFFFVNQLSVHWQIFPVCCVRSLLKFVCILKTVDAGNITEIFHWLCELRQKLISFIDSNWGGDVESHWIIFSRIELILTVCRLCNLLQLNINRLLQMLFTFSNHISWWLIHYS